MRCNYIDDGEMYRVRGEGENGQVEVPLTIAQYTNRIKLVHKSPQNGNKRVRQMALREGARELEQNSNR